MKSTPAKIAGIVSLVAAVVLVVAGILTWTMITTQLKDEKIVVAADAKMMPGKAVEGPLTAYAQAEIIKVHALHNKDVPELDGKTYAQLGKIASDAKAAGNTQLADAATAMRATAMNGSFLRSSLFTSVLAYGVSAMVIGLGIMFGLIGWALLSLSTTRRDVVVERAPATV